MNVEYYDNKSSQGNKNIKSIINERKRKYL